MVAADGRRDGGPDATDTDIDIDSDADTDPTPARTGAPLGWCGCGAADRGHLRRLQRPGQLRLGAHRLRRRHRRPDLRHRGPLRPVAADAVDPAVLAAGVAARHVVVVLPVAA